MIRCRKNEERIVCTEPVVFGNAVRISDPCYSMDVWCAGTIHDVLPGKYVCYLFIRDCGEWGSRVSRIAAIHEGCNLKISDFRPVDFEAEVDSGMCGIYDLEYYRETHSEPDNGLSKSWYMHICDMDFCKQRRKEGTLDGKCFISSSGYGDDGYQAMVARNEQQMAIGFYIDYAV